MVLVVIVEKHKSDQKLNRGPTACPLRPGHTPAGPTALQMSSGSLGVSGPGVGRQRGSLAVSKEAETMSQGGAELQSWLSRPEQVPALTLPSLKWVSSAAALTLLPELHPQCSETSAVFEGRG